MTAGGRWFFACGNLGRWLVGDLETLVFGERASVETLVFRAWLDPMPLRAEGVELGFPR